MLRIVFVALLLWSASSFGGVDDLFSSGVLGVRWDSRLDEVRKVHPDGTAWDSTFDGNTEAVYYAVSGDLRFPGLDIPTRLVHFIFTKDQRLQAVFFHFKYSDRESVLYGIAQILGQDYSVKDEAGTRQFTWPTGEAAFAKLDVGNSPQNPWVHLAVRPLKNAAKKRN